MLNHVKKASALFRQLALVALCLLIPSACSDDEPGAEEQPCLVARRLCGETPSNACANSRAPSTETVRACLARATDCQIAVACLEAEQ